MEWKMEASPWDLSEFKQEETPTVFDGGDFSIDLKLGRVSNSIDKRKQPGFSTKMESSSSWVYSKRARADNDGSQAKAAFCIVDGCKADLTNCRDYHKRHKVCELHSKSPEVAIAGQKRRFCQQCSRFHCLEEFDEGKRSCRTRLDGHNRRRRKARPHLSPSASYLSNYEGTQLLASSSSQIYPSGKVMQCPNWCGTDCIVHQQSQRSAIAKHDQFDKYEGLLQVEGHQIAAPLSALPASCSMLCNRLIATTQVPNSDCAPSLLSSADYVLQPNSIPFTYSLPPTLSVPQSPQTLQFQWE